MYPYNPYYSQEPYSYPISEEDVYNFNEVNNSYFTEDPYRPQNQPQLPQQVPTGSMPGGMYAPPPTGPTHGGMYTPPSTGPTHGGMYTPPSTGPTPGGMHMPPPTGPTHGGMHMPPPTGPTHGGMHTPPPTGPSHGGMHTPPYQGEAPTTPPPLFVPQLTHVSVKAIDAHSMRRCLYRNTYVWLMNGRRFWFYPTFVGRTSVAGYRWSERRQRWAYFGIDASEIRSFQCF